MKRLPNKELSLEEYLYLIKNYISRGGEGIICQGTRKDTVFKLFINLENICNPMSENKERKITELYQMNIDSLVKPLRTISYNGIIIGYEMSYDEFDISLKKITLPRKDLIKALKSCRKTLIELDKKDITFGDVTEDNVLYNIKTGRIKLCDIDNIRLGTLPIDIKGFSLNKYYSATGVIDKKSDAYMHNILTLKSLSYDYDTYDTEILLDLKRKNYPPKYKLPAKKIFESMPNPESFNGEYVIEYVKR